ncbi:hypothetical protein HaLaN_12998, partial [Haematococcus lacustris]
MVLALQQLAWLCEGRGTRFSALRSAVWADDSGRSGWTPLATFLMVEVRDMVAAVAAALPACDASRPKPNLLVLTLLLSPAEVQAAARARRSGRAERLLLALTWLTGPQPHATLLKAEVAAYTLEQEARRGVQAVAAAFGPSLLAVVKESPVKAAYGSPPELAALLASMLAWQ